MAEPGAEPAALPRPRERVEGSGDQASAGGWGKPEPFLPPCCAGFVFTRQTWLETPEVTRPCPLSREQGWLPASSAPAPPARRDPDLPGCSARSPGRWLAMLAALLPPVRELSLQPQLKATRCFKAVPNHLQSLSDLAERCGTSFAEADKTLSVFLMKLCVCQIMVLNSTHWKTS